MAATKQGIVYATISGMPRRVIIPDDDASLNDPAHVQRGESLLIVDRSQPTDPASLHSLIQAKIGIVPANARCAIVDSAVGHVLGIIMADAAIDVPPANTVLVNHPEADIGWRMVGGKLVKS